MSGEFDLLMLCSSWDRRSVCIAQADDMRATYGTLLLFDKRDNQGFRERHDKVLAEFARSHTKVTKEIKGQSSDITNVWNQLYENLRNARNNLGKPLKICVDISACPRIYFLAILGTSFKTGLAESVSFFYSEGVYSKDNKTQDYVFYSGHWETMPIPSL